MRPFVGAAPCIRIAPHRDCSLILAILSFTCGWLFTATPAVICGHIAWSRIRKSGGMLEGTNVVFLHTTVDDGDHFQQILAWTLKFRWEEKKEMLREVTASFRSG